MGETIGHLTHSRRALALRVAAFNWSRLPPGAALIIRRLQKQNGAKESKICMCTYEPTSRQSWAASTPSSTTIGLRSEIPYRLNGKTRPDALSRPIASPGSRLGRQMARRTLGFSSDVAPRSAKNVALWRKTVGWWKN